MALLGVIIYGALFALGYAWAAVCVIERRDKKYRQGTTSFSDAFMPGAFILLFVYITNMLVLVQWPSYAITYDLVLLAGLGVFSAYREIIYRSRDTESRRRLIAEARLVEIHMKKDPGNAALFERASELYEQLGEREKAIEAARAASELDPTVRNSWRFKELLGEDGSAGGKRRGHSS